MKFNAKYGQLIKYTAFYFKVLKIPYFHHKSSLFDLRTRTHFCTVALFENNVNTKLYPILKITSGFGIDEKKIEKVVVANPELLNVSSNTWNGVFSILLNSGFTAQESLQMISICPKLLKMESTSLEAALKCWWSVKLGDNNIITLIMSCPELLYVNLKDLPRKIYILKSIGSNKNVLYVLRTCPHLVFENCNSLIQKVEYIENVMKISSEKILKCQALSRSLSELKDRHIFLERAGKYVPPNAKKDVTGFSTNPSLKQITDTDDLKFATCVAGLTLEEFEVFLDLHKIEDSESDIEDD